MAFRKKYKRIVEDFAPDIMVIQECEEPNKLQFVTDGQFAIEWVGDNRNKGLAILSKNNLKIQQLILAHRNVRYMLPVEVDNIYKIIAFWAMNDKKDWKQRYIGQVWVGLNTCLSYIDDKTFVIGDFNWNVIWDDPVTVPLYGKLTDVINLLKKFRIESSYHYLRSEDFGKEAEKTFYLQRRLDKGYHTDYIFAPAGVLGRAKSFVVGKYDKWTRYSDHMPLCIEF